MRLAIMQPYIFPYLGYFQLINSADTFVIYDDVSFRKQSWINRNFVYSKGSKQRFTLQLVGASSNKWINQIEVGANRGKLLKTIQSSYGRAPYFKEVFPFLSEVLLFENDILSIYVANSIQMLCAYMGISTKIIMSSTIKTADALRGERRVLSMCKSLGASTYVNASGGRDLYSRENFRQQGVELKFIHTNPVQYRQFGEEFIPDLSIIDVLMFNSRTKVSRLLDEFELI